jgi:hypothetical protein
VSVNGIHLYNVLLLFEDILKKGWTYPFNVEDCKYTQDFGGRIIMEDGIRRWQHNIKMELGESHHNLG